MHEARTTAAPRGRRALPDAPHLTLVRDDAPAPIGSRRPSLLRQLLLDPPASSADGPLERSVARYGWGL